MTTIQRIPPQNIDAEQALLGTILITGKVPSNFSPELFFKDSHKIIFSAMLKLSAGGVVDITTLVDYLRNENKIDQIGGVVYLATLADLVPALSNFDKYAKIIRQKAALRKIIAASQEAEATAYEEQGDTSLIITRWQRQLYETQSMLGILGSEVMDADLDNLFKSFCARKIHLKCLNNAIGGLPKNTTIVGGSKDIGKTSLNLGFLHKIAVVDGQRVAYFGSCVKKDDLYLKLLCSMTGIGSNVLTRGSADKKQRKKFGDALRIIRAAPISPFTMSTSMSAIDIVSKTRALVEEYGKDEMGAIIIENLQQLVWPEPTKTRKEELDIISRCLKELALGMDIPVVISSRVNRNISLREDKRPKITDFLGTSEIESIAQLALLLYWEGHDHTEIVSRDEEGFLPAEIIVYSAGMPTILPVKFNPLTFQWKDAEN